MTETRGCIKLELDDSKYSSFVPVIGVYVAGISLVCLLAMLYDILSAFWHKKIWLPCKIFSLNSLTLTLIGIAIKLPLDLTTPMPSGIDQFSKLCGNSFICISMAFLMPSIGLTEKYACLANLSSVTILVVTVVVNTYVQLRTGVIFMFRTEHVIVICCMIAMLWPLFKSYYHTIIHKEVSLEGNKDLFRKGKGSILQRLKLVYLYAYNDNPQFFICRKLLINCEAAVLCIICSVVLLHGAFKNLSLAFCGGMSDYGWSVWAIVLFQILTVTIGSLAAIYRSWGFSSRRKNIMAGGLFANSQIPRISIIKVLMSVERHHLYLRAILKLLFFMLHVILVFGRLMTLFIWLSAKLVSKVAETVSGLFFKSKTKQDRDVEKYRKLIVDGGGRNLKEWGLIKSVKDMKRCMDISKSKSMESLAKLLLETPPSRPFHTMSSPEIFRLSENLEVSSLSMAVLVDIAEYVLPAELCKSLVQASGEVYDVIQYINDNMKPGSIIERHKSRVAKAIWSDLGIGMHHRSGTLSSESRFQTLLEELKHASNKESLIGRIRRKLNFPLHNGAPSALLSYTGNEALAVMMYMEQGCSRATEHGIYEFIQQLFVDMLHMFLTQLPHAIYKQVIQSTAEDFHESVKSSIGILGNIKSLETHFVPGEGPVKWSFPVEFDIYELVTHRSLNTQAQVDSLEEQKPDVDICSLGDEDCGVNVLPNSGDHVIVLVE